MRFINVAYPTQTHPAAPVAAYADVQLPEPGARVFGAPRWGHGTLAITWVVDDPTNPDDDEPRTRV